MIKKRYCASKLSIPQLAIDYGHLHVKNDKIKEEHHCEPYWYTINEQDDFAKLRKIEYDILWSKYIINEMCYDTDNINTYKTNYNDELFCVNETKNNKNYENAINNCIYDIIEKENKEINDKNYEDEEIKSLEGYDYYYFNNSEESWDINSNCDDEEYINANKPAPQNNETNDEDNYEFEDYDEIYDDNVNNL